MTSYHKNNNVCHLAARFLHLLPGGMLSNATSETPGSIQFTQSVKTVSQAPELIKHDSALETWTAALVGFTGPIIHLLIYLRSGRMGQWTPPMADVSDGVCVYLWGVGGEDTQLEVYNPAWTDRDHTRRLCFPVKPADESPSPSPSPSDPLP